MSFGATERVGVEADVIDTGHLPALARPAELAEWIEGRRADRPLVTRRR